MLEYLSIDNKDVWNSLSDFFLKIISKMSYRRYSKKFDPTEELADILLSAGGSRRQRYEEMVELIPDADLNSKVITSEDEYVPVGKLSTKWKLPGVFSVFEAFIKYEFIPMMADLLQN